MWEGRGAVSLFQPISLEFMISRAWCCCRSDAPSSGLGLQVVLPLSSPCLHVSMCSISFGLMQLYHLHKQWETLFPLLTFAVTSHSSLTFLLSINSCLVSPGSRVHMGFVFLWVLSFVFLFFCPFSPHYFQLPPHLPFISVLKPFLL